MKIGVFEARKLIGDISFSYFSLEVCENVIFNVFPSPPLPVVLHLDWSKCGDFRSGRTLTEPSVCTCGTKDRPRTGPAVPPPAWPYCTLCTNQLFEFSSLELSLSVMI